MTALPTNLERETEVAREAARAAGEVVALHFERSRESWEKSADNPVTAADLEANRVLIEVISGALPDDAILSEESTDEADRLSRERVWICDPLDGTKEFVAGIPEFSVSIALTHGGTPVVGAIYHPLTRECFWAARGQGAYLDKEPLHIRDGRKLSESVVLVSRTEASRGQLNACEEWTREIWPMGSVALKLARVAAGEADLWVSVAPKREWDVCGGDLIIREAGGVFATREAASRRYNASDLLLKPPMAAGSQELIDSFLERAAA